MQVHADAAIGMADDYLVDMLVDHERLDLLRQRAATGDWPANIRLADLAANAGDMDQLWALDAEGNWFATQRLADIMVSEGRPDQAIALLRARADAGDALAAGSLPDLLAEHGQLDELQTRAAEDPWYAPRTWARYLVEHDRLPEAMEWLGKQIGGTRHLAASIEDLNAWPDQPDVVVIIENKETAYALTTDRPGMIVLHGEGFDVATYARLNWVHHTATKVIYWGDIDLAGLHFLDDLRAYGVQVQSILMDLPTLNTYRHLAVEGATPYRKNVAHLTDTERELYDHLATHATETGRGLLLEQERVPWTYANGVLMAAAEHHAEQ